MSEGSVSIGEAARLVGMTVEAVRFYEARGVIPPAGRTASGRRRYTRTDLRRLRLARGARLLGLSLEETAAFVAQAFSSDCAEYAHQLLSQIESQAAAVQREIERLQLVQRELDELDHHVRQQCRDVSPGQRLGDCGFCPLLDPREGGDPQWTSATDLARTAARRLTGR